MYTCGHINETLARVYIKSYFLYCKQSLPMVMSSFKSKDKWIRKLKLITCNEEIFFKNY